MRELSDSDTDRPQEQKVAICLRAWRDGKADELVGVAKEVAAKWKERSLRMWLHSAKATGYEHDEG